MVCLQARTGSNAQHMRPSRRCAGNSGRSVFAPDVSTIATAGAPTSRGLDEGDVTSAAFLPLTAWAIDECCATYPARFTPVSVTPISDVDLLAPTYIDRMSRSHDFFSVPLWGIQFDD